MSKIEIVSTALSVIGIGLNFVLGLVSAEWRDAHKRLVSLGNWVGLGLIGLGFYLFLFAIFGEMEGWSMLPKISILIGAVLLVGGAIALFISPTKAVEGKAMDNKEAQAPVVGVDIQGHGQVGAAVEIVSTGTKDAPSLGGESTVHVQPGQSAIGTRVIQSGPGTGMRVIQNGPGVGFRSTVIVGGPEPKK
ncbi:MAG TPA: hypothetical protein PKA55_03165 [Rhodoblastus sp.]|nr:hypothetical protein [Rhodoblastus sp.]